MARKTINIGTTGNDATGDSIREGFNKVNQNFTEVYSKLGLEGGLNFTALDDTPTTLSANRIISVSTDGTSIVEKTLQGDGIGVDFGTDPTKIIISNTGTEVSLDNTPELGGDLNAQNFLIENLGTPEKSSDAVNKNYADNTFLNVKSNSGTYNNKSLDMVFEEDVKALYEGSELYAEKAEYSNSKSFLIITNKVKVVDSKGTIFADKLLFDIKNQTLNIASFKNSKINANVNLNEKRF